MQVTGAELEDTPTPLTTYFSEDVLAEMLANEEKRSKGAKQKNRIVRTLSLPNRDLSACSTCVVLQAEVTNVSSSFLTRGGPYQSGHGSAPTVQVSARLQITPFLRSGWILNHPMRCAEQCDGGHICQQSYSLLCALAENPSPWRSKKKRSAWLSSPGTVTRGWLHQAPS